MGISLRTNIASIQANNSLNKTNDALAQNMTKLSSGMRINSAGDDAAGLAISPSSQPLFGRGSALSEGRP